MTIDVRSLLFSPQPQFGSPGYNPMAGFGENPPNIFNQAPFGVAAAPVATPMAKPSFLQDIGFLGSKDANGITTEGWGVPAIGAAQGLANLYMGMKQYGLAKETLNNNKAQFALNYDAQRQSTNAALEDRQRARIASNPGAYQSVGDYMALNGVRAR